MDDRDGWRERVRKIHAGSARWWRWSGATIPGQSGLGSNGNEGSIQHSLKLQHCWSLAIKLFSILSRILMGRSLPCLRDSVSVFCGPSRLVCFLSCFDWCYKKSEGRKEYGQWSVMKKKKTTKIIYERELKSSYDDILYAVYDFFWPTG